MNQTAKSWWQRALLRAACALLMVTSLTVAVAQNEDRSHRRLELPEGGTSDFRTQMQMMSQLQKLFGQQQTADGTNSPGVSPQQMNMLRKMMENFSGQVPQDLMDQIGNLPPEVISQIGQQIQNNPAARQQAMEMLQQFMRNRQLPQGGGRGGLPMLPPNDANGSRPDGDQRNQNSDKGSSSDENNGDSSDNSGGFSLKDFTVDGMMEKMRELERQSRSQHGGSETTQNDDRSTSTSGSGSPSSRNGGTLRRRDRTGDDESEWDPLDPNRENKADRRLSQNSPQDAPRRLTPQEGINRIDELLQQRQNRNRGANTNGGPDSRSGAGSDSASRNQNSNDNSSSASGSNGKKPDGPVRSMSDFLKKFVPGMSGNGGPDRVVGEGTNPPNGSGSRQPSGRSVQDIRQEQEEVKQEVAQRGFAETLKRIGREALKEARSERPGGSNSSAPGGSGAAGGNGTQAAPETLSDSMVEAITGIARDVTEILKDEGITLPGRGSQKGANSGNSNSSAAQEDSVFSEITESASDMIGDLTSTPPVPDAGTGLSAEGPDASAIIPLLVFGLLLFLAMGLAWKSGLIAMPGVESPSAAVPLKPGGIRTKADVVRAFHQMALTPQRASDDWWTHRRVVDTLIEQEPHKMETAETLGRLYEVARYLPDDYEFTDEQLENARLAIAEYRS